MYPVVRLLSLGMRGKFQPQSGFLLRDFFFTAELLFYFLRSSRLDFSWSRLLDLVNLSSNAGSDQHLSRFRIKNSGFAAPYAFMIAQHSDSNRFHSSFIKKGQSINDWPCCVAWGN